MMNNIDWSKAPEWATCVVSHRFKVMSDYHWSALPAKGARMMRIDTGTEFEMSGENIWEIVEKRPVDLVPKMKCSENMKQWEEFDNDDTPGWATYVVINKVTNTFAWSDGFMYAPILRNPPQAIHNVKDFEIVAKHPVDPVPTVTVSPPTGIVKSAIQNCVDNMKRCKTDNVNHPDHYTQGGIECIDAIAAATVGKTGIEAACVANIIKYLWRYELKNGVEDIKKAQWYLNKLLEVKTDER